MIANVTLFCSIAMFFNDYTKYGTSPSSNQTTVSENDSFSQIKSREIVAWILVFTLSTLLLVSSVLHVVQAVCLWAYRRGHSARNLSVNMSPECAVAMDSNPCYEVSTVKQTETDQEAIHIYETVKQHK